MEKEMGIEVSQEQALTELKKGFTKAKQTLKDKQKIDNLLERLEEKLKVIPRVGEKLSYAPVFIQLLKCYVTKQYTNVPIASVVGIVAALTYLLNPLDLIPDAIPGIGFLDDAAILAGCYLLVENDVKEFLEWRNGNQHIMD